MNRIEKVREVVDSVLLSMTDNDEEGVLIYIYMVLPKLLLLLPKSVKKT